MFELRFVTEKDEKTAITLDIMNALPEWFSPPEDIIVKSKTHRGYPFFAVFDHGKAVGFASLKIHNEFTADVYVIGVLREYHHFGIGHQLIEACVNYCRQYGYRFLTVKTLDESAEYKPYESTRRFYQKEGFLPLEVFHTFWDEENPCLFLVKIIGEVSFPEIRRTIVVEEYDPKWPQDFQAIKAELTPVLSGLSYSIEHVGSTSVPGLAAKPIIDIDIVIPTEKDLPETLKRLSTIGYYGDGDHGIKGREVINYEGKEHLKPHNLYVCAKDSGELRRHTTFRDYLRKHPQDVIRYGNVKKEGAKRYPHDINCYIEHKTSTVLDIYQKCGLNAPKE